MNELKKCPFCQNEGYLYKTGHYFAVACVRCGNGTQMHFDADFVIDRWNKRKGEEDEKKLDPGCYQETRCIA